MPSKRIIAVLLYDYFVYMTEQLLNRVYITDSVSTSLPYLSSKAKGKPCR